MDKAANIFLIGPMGSGKTTIGRQLAKVLDKTFVDSDQEIETRTGANIPWIFDIEGEAGFRQREQAVIDELTRRQGVVLATGGGAVLAEENRRHLAERGVVIYLRTSIEQQLRRTAKDRNRPLLQTDDPRARLEALLARREPLYQEIANIIVDTDNRSIRSTVNTILKQLRQLPDAADS